MTDLREITTGQSGAGVYEAVPDFLKADMKRPEPLSEQALNACYEGWMNVLSEHPGVFEEERLLDIKAANVITSFMFWHHYLHGNEEQRVREIYDKMTADYNKYGGM